MDMIFNTCIGTNNKVDPIRLFHDPEQGIIELENSKDIMLDSNGYISSIRGNDLLEVGDFISSYPAPDNSFFYVVKNRAIDSAIYKVTPDSFGELSLEGIRSGLPVGAKIDFCNVDDKTYYANGFELGVLNGESATVWPVSEYPRETSIIYIKTPVADHLDIISGQFIFSKDKELFYTDPGLWGLIDANKSWRQFESRILMLYAVDTGMYVSDSKYVYFLQGKDPDRWEPNKVLNYPAKEFCRVPGLIDPSRFGFQTTTSSALFGTVNGPCIGLSDGTVVNLIDKKVTMPKGSSQGSIMVVDETIIIQSEV